MLEAMMMVTRDEARKHLSEAGREEPEMMDYTSRNTWLTIADAYVEASATGNLSKRDKDIIKAYLARRTLIEAFSEETVGGSTTAPCAGVVQGLSFRA